ncbi:MAG: WbqC family protein [Rhodocyclales bacterium]|nr:WbqC family protein [Rhodocyclales bacterium]
MRLGMMQPYFFPFLGHFDLIRSTDRWIVFDTPQYIRHGWINRNRILHPDQGWQWILVPLRKHSHTAAINDVEINEDLPWRRTILGQLTHYRRRAPYYDTVVQFVQDCLSTPETSLARLNARILERACRLLGVPFSYQLFSEMNLAIDPVAGPGDWALRVAAALGADEYVNPPGGEPLFDRAAFAAAGIALTIRQPPCMEYRCRGYGFEPHLSIIDVLMWNRPEEISEFLFRESPRLR